MPLHFDGKRWRVGHKSAPVDGFATYADASRWISRQATEDLL